MREILFRGKRKDNGEWVYGYYVCDETGQISEEPIAFIYHLNNHPCGWDLIPFEVIPETVGQFTGLLDKNGKKIFEGDILHFRAYRGGGFGCPIGTDICYRVLFGHCNPDMDTLTEYVGFWALGKNYDEVDLYENGTSISYLVDSHGACVIGTIHDNPELMEVQE